MSTSILNDFGVTKAASVQTSRRRKPRSGRTLSGCICPNCRSAFARNEVNRRDRRAAKLALRQVF